MTTTSETHQAIVVGAGISGLTAAYQLMQAGVDVVIIERGTHSGGCLRTHGRDGYLAECGPNGFLSHGDELFELIHELDLDDALVEANQSFKNRYIYSRGQLKPVPTKPSKLFKSELLSSKAKLRLMCEPFISKSDGQDESLADFVRRRLGNEVVDSFIDPMASGIFAGDVEQMSASSTFPQLIDMEKRYGSLLRAMLAKRKKLKPPTLFGLQYGMQQLIDRLVEKLGDRLRTGCGVTRLQSKQGTFKVQIEYPHGARELTTRTLIMATPAYTAAELLTQSISTDLKVLDEVPYVPLVSVSMGFPKQDIPRNLDGYGYLIPRKEKLRTLGVIWASSIFPHRAPYDHALFTCMIGGAHDMDAIKLEKDRAVELAHKELGDVMGILTMPNFMSVAAWKRNIPQYNIGHAAWLEKVQRAVAKVPGLLLTGNYLDGVSVIQCVRRSFQVSEKVVNYLERFGRQARLQTPSRPKDAQV